MSVKDKILSNFKNGKLRGRTEKEICRALGIPRGEERNLRKILRGLCDEGLLCLGAAGIGALRGKENA